MSAKWKRIPFGWSLKNITDTLNNHNVEHIIEWNKHRVLVFDNSIPSWLYFPRARCYRKYHPKDIDNSHHGIEATPYQFLKEVKLTKEFTMGEKNPSEEG